MKFILLTLALFFGVASAGATQIQLTKNNTLSLNEAVLPDTVSVLMQEAKALDSEKKSDDPIYLFLNTPGGSIQDGLELIENLKSLNRPVHTVTLFAASMGFQIVQNMNTRYILSNGVLMSHSAAGRFSGEFGNGFSQLDSRISLWVQRILDMDTVTVKRTKGKQTLESYRKSYQPELWLTGDKAVEQGYADEVVTARCDTSMSGTRYQTVMFMGMRFKVGFAECPLNTNILSVDLEIPTNKGIMTLTEFMQQGGVSGHAPDYSEKTPQLYTEIVFDLEKVNKSIVEFKNQQKPANRRPIGYLD